MSSSSEEEDVDSFRYSIPYEEEDEEEDGRNLKDETPLVLTLLKKQQKKKNKKKRREQQEGKKRCHEEESFSEEGVSDSDGRRSSLDDGGESRKEEEDERWLSVEKAMPVSATSSSAFWEDGSQDRHNGSAASVTAAAASSATATVAASSDSASILKSRQWSEDFVSAINQIGQDAIEEMKASGRGSRKSDFSNGDIAAGRAALKYGEQHQEDEEAEREEEEPEEFWMKNPRAASDSRPSNSSRGSRGTPRRHSENPGAFSIRGRAPGSLPVWSRRSAAAAAAYARNRSGLTPSRPPAFSSAASSSSITDLDPTEETTTIILSPHEASAPDRYSHHQDILQPDPEAAVPHAVHVSDAEPVVYAVATRAISSKSFASKSDDFVQSSPPPPRPTTFWERNKSHIILFLSISLAIVVSIALVYNNQSGTADHQPTLKVPSFLTCKPGEFPLSSPSYSPDVTARYYALIYLIAINEGTSADKLMAHCTPRNRALHWLANDLHSWIPPSAFLLSAQPHAPDNHSTNSEDIFVSVEGGYVLSNDTNTTRNSRESGTGFSSSSSSPYPSSPSSSSSSSSPYPSSPSSSSSSSSLLILPDGCKKEEPCNLFGPLNNVTFQILQRYGMAVMYFQAFLPHFTDSLDEYQAYLSIQENWLSPSHVCSWKYVNCTDPKAGERNVSALALSGLGLPGTIPYEISIFKPMTTLDMSNNRLTGGIPWSIVLSRGLENLHLQNNRLYGDLRPLKLSRGLVKLTLQNNLFKGEIPTGFGNMKNLVELVLANNSLGGELPLELGNMSSLELFDLRGNTFSGTVPPVICRNFQSREERVMCNVANLDCPCCSKCTNP